MAPLSVDISPGTLHSDVLVDPAKALATHSFPSSRNCSPDNVGPLRPHGSSSGESLTVDSPPSVDVVNLAMLVIGMSALMTCMWGLLHMFTCVWALLVACLWTMRVIIVCAVQLFVICATLLLTPRPPADAPAVPGPVEPTRAEILVISALVDPPLPGHGSSPAHELNRASVMTETSNIDLTGRFGNVVIMHEELGEDVVVEELSGSSARRLGRKVLGVGRKVAKAVAKRLCCCCNDSGKTLDD